MVEADVYPDFSAVTGGQLQLVLGALLTIVLVVAVLMILICAIVWTVSSSHGNPTAVSKAKAGLWVGIAAATLAGAAVTWLNFLISLGNRL